jgi:prepilin peptidase CpaA
MSLSPQVAIALLVGLAAIVEDLRRRTISNWIPATALAGGLLVHAGERGWWGLLTALGGAVSGFAVFLVFYLLGGMGGGDVKLMAGFGAVLGPGRLLEASLWTAGVGGIFALAAVAWQLVRRTSREDGKSASIPYAPAIAFGAWLALLPKGA